MKEKTKKIWLSVVFVALLVTLLGVSYAYWRLTIRQTNTNKYQAACFSVEIDLDSDEPITLRNAYPMTDKKGMKTEPYAFSITNTCEASAEYAINLEVLEESTLDPSMIKYQLNNETPQILSSKEVVDAQINNATAYQLKTGSLLRTEGEDYSLKLWLNENVGNDEGTNKTFKAKIVITSIADSPILYVDNSGASIPELDNGLIPVVYNEEKQSWVKADIEAKWYDYDEQWWANAVTVEENARTAIISATEGTEIPIGVINTMWAWVPRYEYQTDNLGTTYAGGSQTEPGAININFVSQETTTASADNFLVHPAFTFGTQQLSGIWVAKFELSTGKTECDPESESVGTGCDITSVKPTIKPNVTSWRGARVGTFFTTIKNQMNGSNGVTTYGLSNSDTHMIKNMEWGAVAYLSQSKYGKYGNNFYTDVNKEIAINNCWYLVTGIGGDTVSAEWSSWSSATNMYDTAKGKAASTTGNIYGIYDMSGGSGEYVMGVKAVQNTNPTEPSVGANAKYNSGFRGKLYNGTDYTGSYEYLRAIDPKYYDLYGYETSSSSNIRYHIGDATKEVAWWYNDSSSFGVNENCWLARGGFWTWTQSAGIFGFVTYRGEAKFDGSTRATLVPVRNY